MLFLLSCASSPETSARAMRELLVNLTPRVAAQVSQWLGEQGVRPLDLPRLVRAAVDYVGARLDGCRSRSPRDFAAHVERLVDQFLEGDHDGPAIPRVPRGDEGGLLAPAPKTERTAVLRLVLARLTPADRYVLELKLLPRATWRSAARGLGVSVSTAQRRHAEATERAQLVAVDVLAESLDGRGHAEPGGQDSDADDPGLAA